MTHLGIAIVVFHPPGFCVS